MNAGLFAKIAESVPALEGWCSVEKASDLAASVVALRPTLVVEIGVFGGRSLIPMALACQHLGRGRVVAIDPWTAAAAVEGYSGTDAAWWGGLDHEGIYRGFLRALDQHQLTDFVEVVRRKSDDVDLVGAIDIFHCDGQHTEQAVRDVRKFCPNVRVGGLCYLDDIDWVGGGVLRAVDVVKQLGFVELYRHRGESGTGAMFQRTR